MFLSGHCEDADWPLMSAFVGEGSSAVRIDFLIDTGANRTLLSEEDAKFAGLQAAQQAGSSSVSVVGGSTPVAWQTTLMSFVSESGDVRGYELEFGIFRSSNSDYFPSILGRDLLNRWRLTLDGVERTVRAEVLECDFQFDR